MNITSLTLPSSSSPRLFLCPPQTVTSAVKAPVNLYTSESSLNRGPQPSNKPMGGLLSAPTGWLFGGGKQKQQQDMLKSAAFGRLANVDLTAVRAPPAKPLSIVVAGFTAEEAASELLPHFLDFAPANRLVGRFESGWAGISSYVSTGLGFEGVGWVVCGSFGCCIAPASLLGFAPVLLLPAAAPAAAAPAAAAAAAVPTAL